MLKSKEIPRHNDDASYWDVFLLKAAKGSCKAAEDLLSAEIAYMMDLTEDPDADETWNLLEYQKLFRREFPVKPLFNSAEELVTTAYRLGWISSPFTASLHPRHPCEFYEGLWQRFQKPRRFSFSLWRGKKSIPQEDLFHDAALSCLNNLSADHCLECTDNALNLNYNSQSIVSGMLYLSLTWPEVHQPRKID